MESAGRAVGPGDAPSAAHVRAQEGQDAPVEGSPVHAVELPVKRPRLPGQIDIPEKVLVHHCRKPRQPENPAGVGLVPAVEIPRKGEDPARFYRIEVPPARIRLKPSHHVPGIAEV